MCIRDSSPPAKKAGGGGAGATSAAAGDDSPTGGKFPRKSSTAGMTYCQMIEAVLGSQKDRTGSFANICELIESRFHDLLNWKLESDRKTHVWKSSVRKILFSNRKFRRSDGDKNCFTMT